MLNKKCFIACLSVLLISVSGAVSLSRAAASLDGAGFRISLVVPEGDFDAGFGLGAHLDMRLIDWLHCYPSFEYTHAGANYYYLYPAYYHHSINDFSFNGDFRAYPRLGGNLPFSPFGGMGLVLAITNFHADLPPGYPPNYYFYWGSHTDAGIGLDFLFGCDIPMGKMTGTIEMKFRVGANWDMFKLTGGLTFPLGRM